MVSIYIQIGQLTANVSIILWLLKYYIKQIESTVHDVEEITTKLYKERVKLNIIGRYLSQKDKEFKTLWDSVDNLNGISENLNNLLNR